MAEAIGSCSSHRARWQGNHAAIVGRCVLESITVDITEALCKTMGIPFERRPIERTELIIADEIAFVGTLNEITLISEFEGRQTRGPSCAEKHCRALSPRRAGRGACDPAVDMDCRPCDGALRGAAE